MRGAPSHEPQTPEQKREERIENIVAVAIFILIIAGASLLFMRWWEARHNPGAVTADGDIIFPVTTDGDPMLGADTAPVTIIEFSDYGCGACKAFHDSNFQLLKADYIDAGKARFVYRDFPIRQLNPEGFSAAVAAGCAGDQGKYWEFHDALYANQERLGEALYNETVVSLGLDPARFQTCLASGNYDEEVRLDYLDGVNKGGVTATPTFFINGKKLQGNQPYEKFKEMIEEALARSP